jgi:hypothetical protein
MKGSETVVWIIIMCCFVAMYFFGAKTTNEKIEACCFQSVVVLFNIWRVIAVKNNV